MAHVTEMPPNPLKVNSELHPAFALVLERGLQKTPEARYQSGADLAAALREAMSTAERSSRQPGLTRTRLSSLYLPDKVGEFRAQNPLPLPSGSTADSSPRQAAPRQATPAATKMAAGAAAVNLKRPPRRLGLAVAGLAMLALLAVGLVIAGAGQRAGESDANNSAGAAAATTLVAEGGGVTATADLSVVSPTSSSPAETPVATQGAPQEPTAVALAPPESQAVEDDAVTYVLHIVKNRGDSLYVINITAGQEFPLALLRLSDGDGAIPGTEWGVETLPTSACVSVWKDSGNPQPPSATCDLLGQRVTRDGPGRFWRESFNVYYDGALVATCAESSCLVRIRDQG